MKVYLAGHIGDDYEDCWADFGVYSSREKAMEAVYAHAAIRTRKIEIRPRAERSDEIIYQEQYKIWSDIEEEYVWDGENWTDAGRYDVFEYELDKLPE